ncbi:MAG: hypothetical protein JWP94_2954 [Mucilaginibacter sp.]|nr:hypothetical protein [Mucilaginibacter sp.]
MKTTVTTHFDVYQIVTDAIIAQLEQNIVPWHKPWKDAGPPANLLTKKPYRGINILLLNAVDCQSNYFVSWKQLKAFGGSVKKGETGHIVVFWKRILQEQKSKDDQPVYKAILRYYKVFNTDQCNAIPSHLIPTYEERYFAPNTVCDEIVERMPNCPVIKQGKQAAFYDPLNDVINMPKQGTFGCIESYYSTLFHELVHSTGHVSRLARKEITEPNCFGSELYSIEELTAEIGTTFLQSLTGISEREFDNSVSYINGWLKQLRNDKKLIVQASGQAQRAVDFILNVAPLRQIEPVHVETETQ